MKSQNQQWTHDWSMSLLHRKSQLKGFKIKLLALVALTTQCNRLRTLLKDYELALVWSTTSEEENQIKWINQMTIK